MSVYVSVSVPNPDPDPDLDPDPNPDPVEMFRGIGSGNPRSAGVRVRPRSQKAGSGLVGSADPVWRVEEDFNLTPRDSTDDIGAHHAAPGGNPGWTLNAGFKPSRRIFEDGFELGSTVEWSAVFSPSP